MQIQPSFVFQKLFTKSPMFATDFFNIHISHLLVFKKFNSLTCDLVDLLRYIQSTFLAFSLLLMRSTQEKWNIAWWKIYSVLIWRIKANPVLVFF